MEDIGSLNHHWNKRKLSLPNSALGIEIIIREVNFSRTNIKFFHSFLIKGFPNEYHAHTVSYGVLYQMM